MLAGTLTTVVVLGINAGRFVTAPLASSGLIWPVYLALLSLGVLVVARTGLWRRAPVVAFVLFWLVGMAWLPYAWSIAPDPRLASREVLALGYSAVLSCAVLLLGRRGGLLWWRFGWLAALVLTGAVAVWEMTTARHLWVNPWPFQPRIAAATYANPNNFGIMLLAMVVALVAWRAETRSRVVRVVLSLATLGAAGLVLLSESRSAALGLIIIGALEIGRRLLAHPGLVRRFVSAHRVLVAAGAVALGVAAAATFVVPALAVHNPVLRMLYAAIQPTTAASDLFRVRVSLLGLRYWWESGFFGTGAGSFEPIMWNDPNSGIDVEANLHNAFVEMLMQYGVVVFVVFAALLVVLCRVLWRTRLAASVRPRLAIVRTELAGHLVVFVALGLTASSSLSQPVWWLVMANACACAATLVDRTTRPELRGASTAPAEPKVTSSPAAS
ncbi:O-antigen ligase family protein [Mobilicoccus massiliensis]|uniref:O-antigen ligase family protein n=1 Tax=Mobilicoccus massiliensis TaxID=1522310 RepID=UPI00059182FA|nr:O-antigen ligase family protein [Mobilicoccus massiliensis]